MKCPEITDEKTKPLGTTRGVRQLVCWQIWKRHRTFVALSRGIAKLFQYPAHRTPPAVVCQLKNRYEHDRLQNID